MALETLKDVKEIGGFKVGEALDGDHFVAINGQRIGFQIQDGPVKEAGVNGCQVDTLIETAKLIINRLNTKAPCMENNYALAGLGHALHWLEQRKLRRIHEGTEGTSKEFHHQMAPNFHKEEAKS